MPWVPLCRFCVLFMICENRVEDAEIDQLKSGIYNKFAISQFIATEIENIHELLVDISGRIQAMGKSHEQRNYKELKDQEVF